MKSLEKYPEINTLPINDFPLNCRQFQIETLVSRRTFEDLLGDREIKGEFERCMCRKTTETNANRAKTLER